MPKPVRMFHSNGLIPDKSEPRSHGSDEGGQQRWSLRWLAGNILMTSNRTRETRPALIALASLALALACLTASPAAAVATGTLTFTQPTGSVSSTDSIDVYYTVALDQSSAAITTDSSGNIISGVTNADLLAAGIDPSLVTRSDINVSFSCSGTFTNGCGGPPYDFNFGFGAGSLSFTNSLDIQPGTTSNFLFGTFTPTGGIAPYGSYTFFDAGVFAQFYDANNNHLGDVAFFDTCGSQTANCAFTRTVDSGPIGGVPEPASWALMLVGFGLTGAVLRRRRTVVAA